MVRSSALKHASYFLRKHRKWPYSPYKTKWHRVFDEHQALQIIKQAAKITPSLTTQNPQRPNPEESYLLSALIDSYNTYNCDPTPSAYHIVLKTLINTFQFHHIPPVLDRLEQVEKFETPEYILADLIKTYGQANKILEAVHLFVRIPKFRCVPSAFSLNALLLVLCRNRESLKMVPQILLKSRLMRIRLEESSFKILITALCRIGKVGFAIEMLNYMINDGYGLNTRICSLILSALCKQKTSSGVKVFLEEMKHKGFRPGPMDYSNVIRSLAKEGKGLDALDVLSQMKADGFKPDIVCYTMVLSGVIAEDDHEKAHELFDELLLFGLIPDIYTYNVFIHGLSKENNVEGGIKMVSSMEELGCEANVITYNILLEVLCKAGELDRARELLKRMKMKGVEKNLRTYRIVLDGLSNNGADFIELCVLLDEMLGKCFSHRHSAFDGIISRLCEMGLASKALELLENIVSKNASPGAKAWEALLLSSGVKLEGDHFSRVGELHGILPS